METVDIIKLKKYFEKMRKTVAKDQVENFDYSKQRVLESAKQHNQDQNKFSANFFNSQAKVTQDLIGDRIKDFSLEKFMIKI